MRVVAAMSGGVDSAVAAAAPGSPEAVAVAMELSLDGFHREDPAAQREWARRAAAGAEALGDPVLLAAAQATLSVAGAWSGDVPAAEAAIAVAAPLVDGGQGAPHDAVGDLRETREIDVPDARHADHGRCTTIVSQLYLWIWRSTS